MASEGAGATEGGAAAPEYDEMALFHENAEEVGLPWDGSPAVERRSVVVDEPTGRRVSGLVWGSGEPELVLLHGGAQNAHTWDTVALALDRPLVAIDLPGHGHSDWREDHAYWPEGMAADVAVAVEAWAPEAKLVVGMSLGGLTATVLAATRPELVRHLGIIDVTPGTDHAKAEPIIAFISGPEVFESFDELLARTIEHNPTRSESSLRRGVLHNAHEVGPDAQWSWRWDPTRDTDRIPDFGNLWDRVSEVQAPILFVRGGTSGVVGDEDVEELLRRQPETQVVVVDGAGHSVQGDRPVELAALLADALGPA
jgi:pimeloyl-ACP methyl ester carboxylesterase